jgi:hypothetical protein
VSTYLITTDDIDFITNLIQSGFDVIRTAAMNLPDQNENSSRKPSVTRLGVLPLPCVPAGLTTTIEDVHQAPSLPHVAFGNSKSPNPKQTRWGPRNLSRALSLKNVPEVIWEDTGPPASPSASSKASSSSERRDEGMNGSSVARLLGQSSSTVPDESSSRAASPGYQGRRTGDDGRQFSNKSGFPVGIQRAN